MKAPAAPLRGQPRSVSRPSEAKARSRARPVDGAVTNQRFLADPVVCLVAVVLALVLQRRALSDAFAPDDLILLEQARGLLHWAPGPWRFCSGRGFWTLGTAVFDGHAQGWHVVVWSLHGAMVVALYSVARALGAGRLIAFASAAWFGTHRLLWDALIPVSSVGEVLAPLFTLTAVLVTIRARRAPDRFAAAALFAAGVLSKESIALLPLAFVPGASLVRRSRLVLAALGVAGAGFLLWLWWSGQAPAGPAYVMAMGGNVITQLLTYTAASTDFFQPVPDLWAPGAMIHGAVALALLTLSAAWMWRRTRLPTIGLVGFILSLGPVLLLRDTRHLHYLYAPLAFLGLALAGVAGALLDLWATATRASPGRLAPAAAGLGLLALLGLHVAHSEAAIRLRAAAVVPETGLPYDPLLRKMTVARNALSSLTPLLGADSVRLAILYPEAGSRKYSVNTGERVTSSASSHPYNIQAAVLDSGRALSAIHPQILETRFAYQWRPEFDGWWMAIPYVDGGLEILGRGPQAHSRLLSSWYRAGFRREVKAHLEAVVAGTSDTTLRSLALKALQQGPWTEAGR